MHFDGRATQFYAAPFPSNDLITADGTIDLSKYPNSLQAPLVSTLFGLLSSAHGFALSGGIYFQATGPLDAMSLPNVTGSVASDSSVFLLSVDSTAPDYLKRYPVTVGFAADGGPYGSPNLLSLIPLQGVPLLPNTTYAAVVTTAVKDAGGAALTPSADMTALAGGHKPSGLSDAAFQSYQQAVTALGAAKVATASIAGMTVFTTWDPTTDLTKVVSAMLARPLPTPTITVPTTETYPDYCVFTGTVEMPDYQAPGADRSGWYQTVGGAWQFDGSGAPVFQENQLANVYVTIPHQPIPAAGYPTMVFVRTGGGGNRPLIDRGTQATAGGPPIVPGSGPAMYFAQAGWAAIEIDGPIGGARDPSPHDAGYGDEQIRVFNVFNMPAMRDNVRESAAELALEAHIVSSLTLNVSSCSGTTSTTGSTTATFDAARLGLMGHSMGAWFAPIALAAEPLYKIAVFSGAGGSWIENVMYKLHPAQVLPFIEALVGYDNIGRSLTDSDPILSLAQWALEPGDPQVYGRYIISTPRSGAAPRHILMEQGIVDHYILPNIANSTSLSIGLDLGGTPLDSSPPEDADETPLLSVLSLVGRSQITLPASANIMLPGGGAVTGVVVQHPSDGIEDGHEVVFQTDPPKHQYKCFLQDFAQGMTPAVRADAPASAPCN
jgi:hypothetical protein